MTVRMQAESRGSVSADTSRGTWGHFDIQGGRRRARHTHLRELVLVRRLPHAREHLSLGDTLFFAERLKLLAPRSRARPQKKKNKAKPAQSIIIRSSRFIPFVERRSASADKREMGWSS
jgi:hypothetical protein